MSRVRLGELVRFAGVGGAGYVVDVVAFNALRSVPALGAHDPAYARVLAVLAAMVVTYLGSRYVTWPDATRADRRRETVLFVVFNLVGLAISLACLVLTHDLLGLTSRLDDNLSANVLGVGLGTLFRFWSYRTFVFTGSPQPGAGPSSGRDGTVLPDIRRLQPR